MQTKLVIAFWISFALSAVTYVVMVAWSLPWISAEAAGQLPFDLRATGYTLNEARSFLESISDEGRHFYLSTQLKLDTLYPPLLAITLALGLWIMAPTPTPWLKLLMIMVPLLGMVADLVENQLAREMLNTPPESLDAETVMMASAATLAKSALTTLAMSGLLVLTIISGWKKWRGT